MLNDPVLRKQINLLPQRPGVYLYLDQNNRVLYIGKAISLRNRVKSYLQNNLPLKTQKLVNQIVKIKYIETDADFSALLLEAKLIKHYLPKYNSSLRDDKSYLYIFISLFEEFPKVFTTRKPKNMMLKNKREVYQNLQGKYFGPFASSQNTYQIVKWLRKIVPFCQQKTISKRACFYSHLGLCYPCPSEIVKKNDQEYKMLKTIYKNNILRLIKILSGEFKDVEKILVKEINILSDKLKFEEAEVLRNRLYFFHNLLYGNNTASYLANPNYLFETKTSALMDILRILNQTGIGLPKLNQIEA